MVQFVGQVVDNQGASQKKCKKWCRMVQFWFPKLWALAPRAQLVGVNLESDAKRMQYAVRSIATYILGVSDPLHCYNHWKHWRFLRSRVLQTRYKVLQGRYKLRPEKTEICMARSIFTRSPPVSVTSLTA